MACPENEALRKWLAKEVAEPVLETGLEIVDSHHHLWDWRRPHVAGANAGIALDYDPNVFEQKVYYAEHMAADIAASGHNVVQTVFAECGAMYRESGPVPDALHRRDRVRSGSAPRRFWRTAGSGETRARHQAAASRGNVRLCRRDARAAQGRGCRGGGARRPARQRRPAGSLKASVARPRRPQPNLAGGDCRARKTRPALGALRRSGPRAAFAHRRASCEAPAVDDHHQPHGDAL
eukprot:SAG11_NODE_854_length_6864_cov_6.972087_2_plen_236_part_00